MSKPVIVDPRAVKFLRKTSRWWTENRSPQQADRWFNGFVMALDSLSENPERHALANENDAFPIEVRQMNYGLGRRPTHRALFTVRPDMIYVFVIRHLAQHSISPDELWP